MISKTPSFRDTRNPIGVLILLAALAAAAGCSTSTNSGGLVDASGNHPAGFVSTHPAFARPDGIACKECHGSNLQGGIVNVSCFSASRNGVACHASGPAFHPANWVDTKARGTSAWHGDAFLGNVLINGVACSSCHTLGTSGTPGTGKCVTCHFTYTTAPVRRIPVGNPTVHDWSSSQTAGHSAPAFANDNVVNAVCVACHETNIRFANPPQECHNCHAPFPSGHPAGWVAVPADPQPHGVAAKAVNGFPGCQTCHGPGLTGSTSSGNVSCFQATWNGFNCHNGGAVASWPHAPPPWRTSAGSVHTHTNTDNTGSPGNPSVCADCHQSNPGTPGCFNSTLCHGSVGGGGAAHPVPFNTTAHYTVDNTTFTANCGTCHAVTGTSPVSAAPLCTTCHTAGSPLTALNCTSCHANPPGGATTAYPNVAGAHDKHLALAPLGNTITCDTCHSGYGTGTAEHYKRAYNRVGGVYPVRTEPGDVAFLATYYAASGASTFDNAMVALSCSNVSCHGGQATPNWQTGTLDVDTQCTNCHVFGTSLGNPQYNSPYSGRHDSNPSHRTCTNCHNITTLKANHFTTLADNTISPDVASATIGGTGTLVTTWTQGAGTSGTCLAVCHSSGVRTW